jgi:NADH dehydrogenase (ubiquinone) flavoprotein 1
MLRRYLSQGLKLSKYNFKFFSTVPQPQQETGVKKVHGGLKDTDRIFTNVYRDGDQFVEGALKRVK